MKWILGLDILRITTESQSYQLRVDLEDWDGNAAYYIYKYDCSILFSNLKTFLQSYKSKP